MPNSNSSIGFSEEDLGRIRRDAPIEHLEFHKELDSTNNLALQLTEMQELPLPMLVLAESQSAGRGQRERQWWSAPGALTFSLVIAANDMNLPPELWPKVSLTTGLAISEALEDFIPGEKIQLKWPNDVYVQGKKLCGILVESQNLREKRLVIGVGINVNNSVFEAPAEVADLAIAICDLKGQSLSLVEVLLRVVQRLNERLRGLASCDAELAEELGKRCLLTGCPIRIESPTSQLEGVCQGIDGDGALLLQTDSGIKRCLAGTVTLFED